MTDSNDYDKQVEVIRAYNQPILDAFQAWLKEAGLVRKTIKNHVDNIDFFTDYLVYDEPLKRLDEADDDDVFTFLTSWFPRKAMWANVTNVKSYLASFKKFFKWMGETERISDETVTEVLYTLKEHREEFLEAVDDDLSDIW
jgi:site-specific recombinase XerD